MNIKPEHPTPKQINTEEGSSEMLNKEKCKYWYSTFNTKKRRKTVTINAKYKAGKHTTIQTTGSNNVEHEKND